MSALADAARYAHRPARIRALARVVPGLAVAAALLGSTPRLAAQEHERAHVLLLREKRGSRFSLEILARLRGELSAFNVELQVAEAPEWVPAKDAVESPWSEQQPSVVLFVQERREANRRTEEIWLSDRLANRLFVQRVNADPTEPARSARWVAVQAAELVRARMADSQFSASLRAPAPSEAAPTSPQVAAPPLTSADRSASENIHLGLGIGLLHGFHSLADTWVPMARLGVRLFDGASNAAPLSLDARLTLGVGIERGLIYGERSANVRQSLATLEATVTFAPKSPVQPLLSLGGGGYLLQVDGSSAAPYENRTQHTWSGLNSLGAGLRLRPFRGVELELDATLMDVWSRTTIRFGSDDVVQGHAPIVLFGATASAVF